MTDERYHMILMLLFTIAGAVTMPSIVSSGFFICAICSAIVAIISKFDPDGLD